MFELFDSPDGIMSCSRRESSTIAPQSLTMLNGRFTVEQSKSLAAKLSKVPAAERIDQAWEHVLSRKPTAEERVAAQKFLDAQEKNLGSDAAALQELGRSLFNLNEFLYVD